MKTLKELYLEAARVAELEEQYPTIFPIRYKNNYYNAASLMNAYINWNAYRGEIEFALAIVEGKPVFKGDALWNKTYNMIFIAEFITCAGIYSSNNGSGAVYVDCSWNPPKPRTVMVELLVEDAKYWTSYNTKELEETSKYNVASNSFYKACRKALEELK